jgi:hypothetical protein
MSVMDTLPQPNYWLRPAGRRFPRCGSCGVRCTALVRTARGWELLCPGRGTPHHVPVPRRTKDAFPPCGVCCRTPEGLVLNQDDELLRSVTFKGCGHTAGIPWEMALGLA